MVLAATLSQAAAVNWNSGTIYTPTPPTGTFGAAVGSGSLYTAVVLFYVDNAGTPGSQILGLTGTTDTTTSAASALNGTAGNSFVVSTVYWAQLFVTSNDGKWKMTSELSNFTSKGTGDSTINFLTGVGFSTVSNKMPTQWTPVPEPGTFALMGIGLAVLGLRRRFMKK